ncbi:hypothetical protein [Streptomyces sp. NPDC002156]
MAYQATASDWFSLLGIDGTLRQVFGGEMTVTAALDDLARARRDWPGTAEDWVAVVDAVTAQVTALRAVSHEQSAALFRLEQSLGEAVGPGAGWTPPPLPVLVDRVLTPTEQEMLTRVPEWFSEIIMGHLRRQEQAEQEAEEAASEYESALEDYETAGGDNEGDEFEDESW